VPDPRWSDTRRNLLKSDTDLSGLSGLSCLSGLIPDASDVCTFADGVAFLSNQGNPSFFMPCPSAAFDVHCGWHRFLVGTPSYISYSTRLSARACIPIRPAHGRRLRRRINPQGTCSLRVRPRASHQTTRCPRAHPAIPARAARAHISRTAAGPRPALEGPRYTSPPPLPLKPSSPAHSRTSSSPLSSSSIRAVPAPPVAPTPPPPLSPLLQT
jgi:hypothetical protein